MADLFHKQAKDYAETRPTYPQEFFNFIVSKVPSSDLAWDVGTGSGQAVATLSAIYKNVVATDTSQKQLDYAPKFPNVRYVCTPAVISAAAIERDVAAPMTVDLVTVAQALHWFDLPNFYQHVKTVLKKPHGVIAAWCYTTPQVNDVVDSVFLPFYTDSRPYWDVARKLVDDKYRNVDFPFEPVDGEVDTGPFEFKTQRLMSLDDYFTYIRSWSAYGTAKDQGVDLLNEEVSQAFKQAWIGDGEEQKKLVVFPLHLRIGKLGN
ncbi:putative methyltransferase DDB_G0268948 [Impatiens glandulifera]|uniref:putative methyltransferase DDB_G0268948 n=1 Tax=Impatiens glandulifera TaxID=253017 RepID=UPI001FB0F48F|nr:putative methyltransferase DDB_G0268948 [Impatiens glandulifera]